MKKKFGPLHVLNLLMITALVLAACAQATTIVAPEKATQSPTLPTATLPPVIPNTGPSPSANQARPTYWPTQDWRTSTPEQQGMDSAQISKLFDAIQKPYPWVHSVLIVRNGTIVTEAYYSPFRPDARHSIVTVTESVVSILIGIAIQEGYIKSVDQKMLDYFADRKIDHMDARKQAITIRDLLSMTSGLHEDDDGVAASDDWVQYQLDVWMDHDPGTVWTPSRSGYILLAAIIQKATGMTALAFANKVLFGPLGISGAAWETNPQGIENGGNRLYLTSRDMAKIGYLYLNNGVWNGKQVVPKDYVLASTKHMFDISSSPGWGYGYGWWIAPDGSYSSEVKAGQLIYVKPSQGMVTVFTGSPSDDLSSEEEGFLDNFIIPAVKSSVALPENPASMAILNDQITALEKDAPQPIPPLPKMAQTISGKKYLLDDGEGFTLTFAGDQATLNWSLKDQALHLPIGMDNVFVTTPVDQTESLSPFGANPKTLNPGFVALRGSWTGEGVFELTMQFLNSTRRQTVSFTFNEDKVNIIQASMNGGENAIVSFQGQVQGPNSTSTTPTPAVLETPSKVTTATSSAPAPASQGQIVFWDDRGATSNPQIYIENADGSGVYQLVKSQYDDSSPVLSPDGRMVIFNRSITDSAGVWQSWQLYIVNVDGTNLHQLDPGGCVLPCFAESFDGHAFSPDGKQIVFNRPIVDATGKPNANGDFASFGLWIRNVDGSGLKQITQQKLNSGESDEFASWSSDGKRLVFQRTNSQGSAIFTVATDGSNPKQITPWNITANDPAWSPDGKLIVYQSPAEPDQGIQNIYTVHPDGTGLTQLTKYTSADGSSQGTNGPSWSPDGSQIVFCHFPSTNGHADLFVINSDGSGLHLLANTDFRENNPDWGRSPTP